jgi:hypothetical protein
MESPRLITGGVPIPFVSDPPTGAGAPAGPPDPAPVPAGFGSGGAASKTLGPKAPPIAPISAVADATGFFFWYGDAPPGPAAVPSRRAAEEASRASAKFHVAALASHSAHRRIEPVTLPSRDARFAPRRGDGLHAGDDKARVASTFVSEEASLLATVHPQSASAVAARRRAGVKEISRDELLVERSVSTDVAPAARRARRLATAAGANRPETAVPPSVVFTRAVCDRTHLGDVFEFQQRVPSFTKLVSQNRVRDARETRHRRRARRAAPPATRLVVLVEFRLRHGRQFFGVVARRRRRHREQQTRLARLALQRVHADATPAPPRAVHGS